MGVVTRVLPQPVTHTQPPEWKMEPHPAAEILGMSPESRSNLCEFQALFSSPKIKEEYVRTVLEKVVPKILQDLPKIMENGWAGSVSKADLNHCHILFPFSSCTSTGRMGEFVRAESPDIILLYHSREDASPLPKDRNILTPLHSSDLRVENKYPTLGPANIDCWSAGGVYFAKTREELGDSPYAKVIQREGYFFGLLLL